MGDNRDTGGVFSSPEPAEFILWSVLVAIFNTYFGEEQSLWSLKTILHRLSVWVLQALGDSDFTAVLRQLLPLMKPRGGEDDTASRARSGEEECGPDELILLLVYLYSLADEAQPSDQDAEEELEKLERELIGQLTLVITQEQHLSPLLQKLTGERVETTAES